MSWHLGMAFLTPHGRRTGGGQVGGCVDGWMGSWVGGPVGRCWQMDGWMVRKVSRWRDGGWMGSWVGGQVSGWINALQEQP